MRQRSSASGRPEGTDGSDFSFRMVVDNRYTKVAKGKSRLRLLISTQAVIYLIGLLYPILKPSKESTLVISFAVLGVVSLLIGGQGGRRSRVNLLRFYVFGSSVAIILSIVCAVQNGFVIQTLQRPTEWETKDKLQLLETARILFGLLVQFFVIITTSSLIGNMSPPKRAS